MSVVIALVLAAAAPTAPCVPHSTAVVTSAIADHRQLRQAMGEPMPDLGNAILLYGVGGHLETTEYSIILTRGRDGRWHGTAVGRSRIWVKDAPFTALPAKTWMLDAGNSGALDSALARSRPRHPARTKGPETPPDLGAFSERIDVVTNGRVRASFYSSEAEALAALLRPAT